MTSGRKMEITSSESTIYNSSIYPCVNIIEQPTNKPLRFRYECEGRSAGNIPGINSTSRNKTYPTIKIDGYRGRAVVIVSCVTVDYPHKPHPYNLIGRGTCKKGVCNVRLTSKNMTMSFVGLGIQCVKKKDVKESLRIREEIQVDPFQTGFEHKQDPTSIDLNAVRLCFQVFIEGSEKGKFTIPLRPVVSNPIYDKKALPNLIIHRMSHYSAPVIGGTQIVLLCEKVIKENIQVRFFEERDGQVIWEDFGEFKPGDVHKQAAILFESPPYYDQDINQPVHVHVQLLRPSDRATSNAVSFTMEPLEAEEDMPSRKRMKLNDGTSCCAQNIPIRAEKYTGMLKRGSELQYNLNFMKSEPVDMIAYDKSITSSTQSIYTETNTFDLPPESDWSMQKKSQQEHLIQYQTPSNTYRRYLEPQLIKYDDKHINLNQVASEPLGNVTVNQPINAEGDANSNLNLDNNPFSFDMNQLDSFALMDSEELAALGVEFSKNFSSGLSISDVIKTQSTNELFSNSLRNTDESTSMPNNFTRMTDATIQEICLRKKMYDA